MKAVLISIRPKWVEKIVNSEKTIEVRKTAPKIQTPFKCYIYETQAIGLSNRYSEGYKIALIGKGKVIGEFVCDFILTYEPTKEWNYGGKKIHYLNSTIDSTCLLYDEIEDYGNGKTLYGWCISDLKVYDKPKKLSEFYAKCNISENKCKLCDNCYLREDNYGKDYSVKKLTRPPQSWQYIEEN